MMLMHLTSGLYGDEHDANPRALQDRRRRVVRRAVGVACSEQLEFVVELYVNDGRTKTLRRTEVKGCLAGLWFHFSTSFIRFGMGSTYGPSFGSDHLQAPPVSLRPVTRWTSHSISGSQSTLTFRICAPDLHIARNTCAPDLYLK